MFVSTKHVVPDKMETSRTLLYEDPLYLFQKLFHAKVIDLFTNHIEKCAQKKKQAIKFHVKINPDSQIYLMCCMNFG